MTSLRFLLIIILGFTLQSAFAIAAPKKSSKTKSEKSKGRSKSAKRESKKESKKEKEKEEKKEEVKAVATERTKIEPIATMPKKLEIRGGLTLWQEAIDASRDSASGKLNTQSEGLAFTLIYANPFPHSRWSYTYGGDFGLGFIKGASNKRTFPDTVRNQRWVYVGGRVGVMNRTSTRTSYGFELPVLYRIISWDINDESFNPERDSSFSVGLALAYENHFSPTSTLHISIGNQYMWGATMWSIAYKRKIW